MSERRYEAEEIAAVGEANYERGMRSRVEPEHDGECLVIDIGTGEYSISEGELAAFEGVGRRAGNRIGGRKP